MSAREILAELPRLTSDELRVVARRIHELTSAQPTPTGETGTMRAERIEGRLLLVSPRVIRQAEVDAILDEFP